MSIGPLEILIVLIVFVLPAAAVVGVAIWFARRDSGPQQPWQQPQQWGPPPEAPGPPESPERPPPG